MARIALISDIHGNLDALEAVLHDIESARVDRIACLGDIVGYGPDPAACVELVFSVCDKIVLGNHDEAILRASATAWFNPRARASLEVTRELLPPSAIELHDSLPDRTRIGSLSLAHATFGPAQYEYVQTPDSIGRAFAGLHTLHGAIGHTHVPMLFACPMWARHEAGERATSSPPPTDVVTVFPDDAIVIVNPGSVGQPRDQNPDASWGLFDDEARTLQVRRVAYDVDAVQSKMERLGLPQPLGERLRVGA